MSMPFTKGEMKVVARKSSVGEEQPNWAIVGGDVGERAKSR